MVGLEQRIACNFQGAPWTSPLSLRSSTSSSSLPESLFSLPHLTLFWSPLARGSSVEDSVSSITRDREYKYSYSSGCYRCHCRTSPNDRRFRASFTCPCLHVRAHATTWWYRRLTVIADPAPVYLPREQLRRSRHSRNSMRRLPWRTINVLRTRDRPDGVTVKGQYALHPNRRYFVSAGGQIRSFGVKSGEIRRTLMGTF